jgi:hypothetical protein
MLTISLCCLVLRGAVLCCGLQGIPDAPSSAIDEAYAAAAELAEQLTKDGTPAYVKVTVRHCSQTHWFPCRASSCVCNTHEAGCRQVVVGSLNFYSIVTPIVPLSFSLPPAHKHLALLRCGALGSAASAAAVR